MPYAMTHNYFAKDVYKRLEPKLKRKIERNSMLVFSEGPDVFCYQFLNPFKMKTLQDFSNLVHETHTRKFFYNYVDHMLKYRLEKKKEIVGSLYGYITHYVLDSYTHPLIYYKTGCYNKHNPKADILSGRHAEMELLIDLYMLEKREHKDPSKLRIDRMIFPKVDYSIQLKNLLNRVYQDVYGVENMGSMHLSSIKQMRFVFKHFCYDPHGIKLKCYRGITNTILPKMKVIQFGSYANNLRSKISYINYEHHTWCHPLDKKETSTDSFFDLYNKAIIRAVDLITFIDRILSGEIELKQLERELEDISYLTGKDCRLRMRMRYFENQS